MTAPLALGRKIVGIVGIGRHLMADALDDLNSS
jgi:hypothetical protein